MIEHSGVIVRIQDFKVLRKFVIPICDLQSNYILDICINNKMWFYSHCPLKRIEAGPSKIKLLFITTQRRNSLESVKPGM